MDIAIKPESGSDVCDEPGEAVGPATLPGQEAQEEMNEQGGPDLPFHGVGRVAEAAAEGLGADPGAKLLGRFKAADIGGGPVIADRFGRQQEAP